MDCVFCKIVKGEIPAEKLFEDDSVFVFMDIRPINPGHVLIVSKAHHETFVDTPKELACIMLAAAQKTGTALLKGLKCDGFNVGINNGAAAGQVIGHTHYHVIPRFANDGLKHWPGRDYQEGQMKVVAERIKQSLR